MGTNEGIQYLRDYLHLPPEIVPSTLRKAAKPSEQSRPWNKSGGEQRGGGPRVAMAVTENRTDVKVHQLKKEVLETISDQNSEVEWRYRPWSWWTTNEWWFRSSSIINQVKL